MMMYPLYMVSSVKSELTCPSNHQTVDGSLVVVQGSPSKV